MTDTRGGGHVDLTVTQILQRIMLQPTVGETCRKTVRQLREFSDLLCRNTPIKIKADDLGKNPNPVLHIYILF